MWSVPAISQQKYTFQQPKMGTFFSLTIYSEEEDSAAAAAKSAFEKIDQLNLIFSDYLPQSELNQLTQQGKAMKWQKVSTYMSEVLHTSEEAARLSNGVFDITIGKLTHLWRKARQQQKIPDEAEIREALRKVGPSYIQINENNEVRLEKEDMQLDVGGIAKGYAAQVVLALLKKKGFERVLVNAGGDITAGSAPPGKAYWTIGLNQAHEGLPHVVKKLKLTDQSVATSGDLFRSFEWQGKKYSHIIHPKTGMALTNQREVTVLAKEGATADWLASACSILSIKEALALVREFPGTGIRILEKKGSQYFIYFNQAFEEAQTE